jgi:uncharacterized membrane protein
MSKRGARIVMPGIVLGLGLGGFFDGIVFHQILQWHNMGSAVLPPTTMEAMGRNMRWDGFFHAATWGLTVAGIYMLLHDVRSGALLPEASAFTGQLLVGAGVFNLVEGVVDHHLLELHHVRDLPAHVPAYDWAFLVVGGVLLVTVGATLARRAGPAT